MSKENTTFYVILGLLTHQDMTGYDIKKRIDTAISNFWDAGYGQIYPALKLLEKDGFVKKGLGEKSKGPNRIIYSITESGRNELMKWLSTPGEKEYVKYEILLKLFFGGLLTKAENAKRIMEFRERNKKNLDMVGLYKQSLSKVLKEDEDHYYYFLTVLFGEHIYKAYIEWADEAVAILKNL